MSYFLKDPGALVDYAFDWAADGYLGAATIAASAWSVLPAEAGGVAEVSRTLAPTRTGVLVGGGVAGRVYRLSNRVTLSDGRVDERTLTLRVEER